MAQNLNKGKQERDNGREKGRLPDGKGRPSGAKIDRPKKPPVSYREEPKPKPYNTNLEGNIKFDKEIYSKQKTFHVQLNRCSVFQAFQNGKTSDMVSDNFIEGYWGSLSVFYREKKFRN